jgi:hypothetical protein
MEYWVVKAEKTTYIKSITPLTHFVENQRPMGEVEAKAIIGVNPPDLSVWKAKRS